MSDDSDCPDYISFLGCPVCPGSPFSVGGIRFDGRHGFRDGVNLVRKRGKSTIRFRCRSLLFHYHDSDGLMIAIVVVL